MKFKKKRSYSAVCYQRNKQIILQTNSGYGLIIHDPDYPPLILENPNAELLGEELIKTLSLSRTFQPNSQEIHNFFGLENITRTYNNWVAYLFEQFGYKTKRTLFKNMKKCGIQLENEEITIRPSRHVKLEAWDGMNVDNIVVSVDSSYEEIGEALMLALSQCL